MDPFDQLAAAGKKISNATNSPTARVFVDKLLGYRISKWDAEGQLVVRKKLDEYEQMKRDGVIDSKANPVELRHTANTLNVIAKSTKYLNSESDSFVAIDNDVFWNAFDHAKNISSEDVQEIIAQILAGEHDSPGSISMQTLNIVKNLDSETLKSFTIICEFIVGDIMIPSKVFNLDTGFRYRPNFKKFQSMQSLGLILPNSMTNKLTRHSNLKIMYQHRELIFAANDESVGSINIPSYNALSPAGQQIFEFIKKDVAFNSQYFEWLKENYHFSGYRLKI